MKSQTKSSICILVNKNKLEVDFVTYGPRGCWAIEVKRKEEISPDNVRGLKAFKEKYPEAECFIVYGGKRRIVYRDFLCIHVEEFLILINPDQTLSSEI